MVIIINIFDCFISVFILLIVRLLYSQHYSLQILRLIILVLRQYRADFVIFYIEFLVFLEKLLPFILIYTFVKFGKIEYIFYHRYAFLLLNDCIIFVFLRIGRSVDLFVKTVPDLHFFLFPLDSF